MSSPSRPERWPYAEGFISQDTFRTVVAALRSHHRGFDTPDRAFSAIQQITRDKTLNTPAQMSLIRRIVQEYQESAG